MKREGRTKASFSTLASSDVEYAKGLTHCAKGVLADGQGTCAEKSLVLDIFSPNGTTDTTSGEQRPAILIVHGGSNDHGDKSSYQTTASANFWAEQGYVAFVPNYRLKRDNGTYPGEDFTVGLLSWSSLYPAVRDVKASLRYIVANADALGVDTSRIVAMGTASGGADILAAFSVNNNSQYTTELSLAEDPTLSTVNAEVNATVLATILRWSASWAVEAYAVYSGEPVPWEAGGAEACPVIQFHGTDDEVIPFEEAVRTRQYLDRANATNCLHVIQDGHHMSFDYGCPKDHPAEEYYCSVLDRMSWSFVQSVEASGKDAISCPAVPEVE